MMKQEIARDFLLDEELKSIRAAAEKNVTAANYAQLATAYNVRGQYELALAAAERATKLDEAHFTGWFEYAIAATTVGEKHLRDILARLNKLLAVTGENIGEIRTAMALTHYYLAEDTRANEITRKVLESGGANSHTFEVFGYIAYNGNDVKAAIRHFLQAVENDAGNFRAHWMIGHCWFELEDLEAAAASYQRALAIQPHFANAWFSLGKIYLVQEDLTTAYQCFSRCLGINPRIWDCYFTQADYYLGHRHHFNAIACCKRILELDPDDDVRAEALNYIGEVHLASRNYDKAREYFERTIAVDADDAVAHNNLGVTLMKKEMVDEAVGQFRRAAELDPTFAYPVTKLGQAYLYKRQSRAALEMFHKALEIDANEYWAWLGISEVHRKNRQYRKQLEATLRAAEISNDDSDVYNFMGIAFQSLRDYENAEKAYLRSLELDPLNRKAANNLGFLYEQLLKKTGDDAIREKAIAAWRQRLLICRETNTSTKGAWLHLVKLGVNEKTIDTWLRDAQAATDVQA